MAFDVYLTILGALIAAAMAAYVVLRSPSFSPVHRVFALGMLALALEQGFQSAVLLTVRPEQALEFKRWSLLFASFLPGLWLIFSFAYGRADFRESSRRRLLPLAFAFAAPLVLAALSFQGRLLGEPIAKVPFGWEMPIDWIGRIYYISFLVIATLTLANLEKTLLASAGRTRWQVKFMVLGLGAVFASRIYTCSHALLFASLDTQIEMVSSGALVLGSLLIAVSLRRTGVARLDIYVSQKLLFRSITLIAVGVYLLAVSFFVRALDMFEWTKALGFDSLLIFLALVTLAAALLSDRLRQGLRHFLSRHLKRPLYDYRQIWRIFTQRSAAIVDARELCRMAVRLVSETLDTLSVSIWLVGKEGKTLTLGASTALSEADAQAALSGSPAPAILLHRLQGQEAPIDLTQSRDSWVKDLHQDAPEFLHKAHMRYCLALRAQGEFLGMLTLKGRVRGKDLSVEDYDLLQVFVDQTAAGLLNIKLADQLQKNKEMEIVQNMSTFFAHDLKNLASRLALTAQNLPRHFENAEFRQDACRVMAESVEKIQTFCFRLKAMQSSSDAVRAPADLNSLLEETIEDLKGSLKGKLVSDLSTLSPLMLDAPQMRSVLVNLLTNASDASGGHGEIRIQTQQRNGAAILTISDNGQGMSEEFVHTRLFRPFQTTKKEGMGIGLYQSKRIVEDHQGRIEVESEEGKGSVFRVILPVAS